jgi:hypothetical protein
MSTGTLPPVPADLVARLRAAAAAASPSEARTWVPTATRATGFQQTLFRVMWALAAGWYRHA